MIAPFALVRVAGLPYGAVAELVPPRMRALAVPHHPTTRQPQQNLSKSGRQPPAVAYSDQTRTLQQTDSSSTGAALSARAAPGSLRRY